VLEAVKEWVKQENDLKTVLETKFCITLNRGDFVSFEDIKQLVVNEKKLSYSDTKLGRELTAMGLVSDTERVHGRDVKVRGRRGIAKKPGHFSRHFSQVSIEWLEWERARRGLTTIMHARNGGEFRIPGTRWQADGYAAEINTIFEFHGDYWHGNPEVFSPGDINPTSKLSFGELHHKTLRREAQLRSLGYTVVSIWEKDWLEKVRGEC
jgi:hypothetical protein